MTFLYQDTTKFLIVLNTIEKKELYSFNNIYTVEPVYSDTPRDFVQDVRILRFYFS